MRTKLNPSSPEVILARLLKALEQELVDASDAEVTEAAESLGMDLHMKGSAAFIGLRTPAKATFADYFGPDALAKLQQFFEARKKATCLAQSPEGGCDESGKDR